MGRIKKFQEQEHQNAEVLQEQHHRDEVPQEQEHQDGVVLQKPQSRISEILQKPQSGISEALQKLRSQDGEDSQEQQPFVLKELLEKLHKTVSSLNSMWQLPDFVRRQRGQIKGRKLFAKVVALCLLLVVNLSPFAALLLFPAVCIVLRFFEYIL